MSLAVPYSGDETPRRRSSLVSPERLLFIGQTPLRQGFLARVYSGKSTFAQKRWFVLNTEFLVYYKQKPASNKGKVHPLAIFTLKGAVLEEEEKRRRKSSVLEEGDLIELESGTFSPNLSGEFAVDEMFRVKSVKAEEEKGKVGDALAKVREQFKHLIVLRTVDAQLVLCANDEEDRMEWVRNIKIVRFFLEEEAS